jgi:hypothetical protein
MILNPNKKSPRIDPNSESNQENIAMIIREMNKLLIKVRLKKTKQLK